VYTSRLYEGTTLQRVLSRSGSASLTRSE
jgi:hypothetical protein